MKLGKCSVKIYTVEVDNPVEMVWVVLTDIVIYFRFKLTTSVCRQITKCVCSLYCICVLIKTINPLGKFVFIHIGFAIFGHSIPKRLILSTEYYLNTYVNKKNTLSFIMGYRGDRRSVDRAVIYEPQHWHIDSQFLVSCESVTAQDIEAHV